MATSRFTFLQLSRRKMPAVLTACAFGLSACVSPVAGPGGRYASPIGDAPVTTNPTPYSKALVCLGEYARANRRVSPRIAVGRIADYTGKEESDGSGRKVTQGASLMAISALAKSGASLVERFDTSVSELELKYANNKLIGDGPPPVANTPGDYRHIMAGQVPGSDFYLVGGVTELNFNIRSAGVSGSGGMANALGPNVSLSGQVYIMNIGLDLRLVDTRTLQVVDVISYQKQIVGRQVGVGVFDFLGGNIYNVSANSAGLEPIQLAVRSVIERAVLEMMANLYGAPGPQVCLQGGDPLSDRTTGVSGGFTPAYHNLDDNNAQTREDPSRWNAHRDSEITADQNRY